MTENFTLFDFAEESRKPISTNKLDIVKMDFVDVTPMTWRELFSGFNKIKAITYSSGINFIYKLIDMFDEAEIIFGCENIMSNTLQDIMAYQAKLMNKIRKTQEKCKTSLLDRIDNGTLHLFVAREKLSHEKIYLLENNDGQKRVVFGSANLSYNAFNGVQRENISFVDGERAYSWYIDVYNDLKDASVDNISRKAIELGDSDENLELLPIADTIKAQRVLVIDPDSEQNSEIEYILDVKKLSDKIKPLAPKADKKGKITIIPEHITRIRRNLVEDVQREKILRSEYPQLVVDIFGKKILLNDSILDLSPTAESIKNDVKLFLNYMNGYSKFHGDYEEMQFRYFEFANWFFCSPFMATMRDTAVRNNVQTLPYPAFGLVYGKSKAGKTTFLETLLKMMIGQNPKMSAPDFTRKAIDSLKFTVKGAPIIVDDLTQARFSQHAIETIKNDDFGVSEHLLNYPAVVISANEDVKVVAPEVVRRTVICRINAAMTNTEVMSTNIVRYTQSKIGTAFYREYLRRMLEIVPELLEILKDEQNERAPDILAYSSKILCDIFNEFAEEVPAYVRELSLEDYFSEQVTGKNAILTIQNAWKANRKAFSINNKSNELHYNAGQNYDADRIIKELPETLEPRRSREIVIMRLDEAKKYFEIDFKKNIFGW